MSEDETSKAKANAKNNQKPKKLVVQIFGRNRQNNIHIRHNRKDLAKITVVDGQIKFVDLPRGAQSKPQVRFSKEVPDKLVPPTAPLRTKKSKTSAKGFVAISAVLLFGGTVLQSGIEIERDRGTNAFWYPLLKRTLPNIGVGNAYADNDKAKPSCAADEKITTLPDYEAQLAAFKETEYAENDMDRLDSVLFQMFSAESSNDVAAIAKKYLKELGLNVEFYSTGAREYVSYGEHYESNLASYPSDQWRVSDFKRSDAIQNFVLTMASRPKAFFTDFDDTLILVPDNKIIEGISGHLHPPKIDSKEGFVVMYSLSNFEDAPNPALADHELGHLIFAKICSIPNLWDDPAFKKINASGNTNILEAYPSDYARDAGPVEDVAEVWEDLWKNGLSPLNSERGSHELRRKQEVLIARFAEYSGMNRKQMVGLIQMNRLYANIDQGNFGSNIHPLRMAGRNLASFADPNFKPEERFEVFSHGPLGTIMLYCKREENGEVDYRTIDCSTGVTAANIPPESIQPKAKDWADGLAQLIGASDPNLAKCSDLNISNYATEYDPNFPAESRSTVYFNFDNCEYPMSFGI